MLYPWFDAHLDLAYLADGGRDMYATDLATCGGPTPPPAVTLPSLRAGNVRWCLATVFTEADGPAHEPQSYPAGDGAAAAAAGRRQAKIYQRWAADGRVGLRMGADAPLRAGILIECADPVAAPDELSWWAEQGTVAVGMAWARAGRYAGGNTTQAGLSDLGRGLVREIDRLGLVHDVSHLSDRAYDELVRLTDRPLIASHSNCRSLLGGGGFGENQRHLRDEQIVEIARRGGTIGLNLFSKFLALNVDAPVRATIDDCVAHIEHVCRLAGGREHVGLGSDMDGGLSAERLPMGIDRPSHLHRLSEALSTRGWSDDEVAGFTHRNWLRVFRRFFGAD